MSKKNIVEAYGLEMGSTEVAGGQWHFREVTYAERQAFVQGVRDKKDPLQQLLDLFRTVSTTPDGSPRFAPDEDVSNYSGKLVDKVCNEVLILSGLRTLVKPGKPLPLADEDDDTEAGEKKVD